MFQSHLLVPLDAETTERLSAGTAPIHNCTVNEETLRLECHLSDDQSCNHTVDLRVICKTHQEIVDKVRFEFSLMLHVEL